MQIYQVLYIKKYVYTTNNPSNNKIKINKNIYYITHMKWPSSFETIMKLNYT